MADEKRRRQANYENQLEVIRMQEENVAWLRRQIHEVDSSLRDLYADALRINEANLRDFYEDAKELKRKWHAS